jgi:hypothetical protein
MVQCFTRPGGRVPSFVLVLSLLLAGLQTASGQDVQESVATQSTVGLEQSVGTQGGRFGIGFASSWPAYGLSGTMQISEAITAEAVLGFLGAISNFGARGWYRFNRNPTYDFYGFASASLYQYRYRGLEYDRQSLDLREKSVTENVLGVGGGAGIEVGLQSLFKDTALPPIFMNWEIGLALASFDHYNFSAFMFGGGVHYRFGGR